MSKRFKKEHKSCFLLLTDAVNRYGETLTEERLQELISAESEELLFSQLDALGYLLPAAVIVAIGDCLKEGANGRIPPLVRLLISLGRFDFEKIVSSCWAAEEVLKKEEENFSSFDPQTKHRYRSELAKKAKRAGSDEYSFAVLLSRQAKEKKCLMGELIFQKNKLFAVVWVLFSVLITGRLLCLWQGSSWMLPLLAVPVWAGAGAVSDMLCAFLFPQKKAPRLDTKKLPRSCVTLTARVSLVSSEKDIRESFSALERFFYMNPQENHCFCLLADLRDASSRYMPDDGALTERARQEVDRLNRLHGDRFCLFLRDRSRLESEDCFGGWERKRGAVCQLVSFLNGKHKNDFYGCEKAKKARYLLTLDSDTNLSVGSIDELLAVALHPLNRPKTKNGRVVKGFGILQPSVKTSLASCYKTLFSRLTSGAGGRDVYSSAEYDREQNLFGTGLFCGKGLIHVGLFEKLVCHRFPAERVLSHDVPEGELMRTLSVSDITLTDSTPKNTVSYFSRMHRWCRGDFQNLFLLRGRLFSPKGKFVLLKTALQNFVPLFSVLSLFMLCFASVPGTGLTAVLLAAGHLFLPFAAGLVTELFAFRHGGALRFFSKTLSGLAQSVTALLFELTAVFKKAIVAAEAFVLAVYRLFSKKKTLQWTASAQVDALPSGLGKYVLDGVGSVLAGGALVWFSKAPFAAVIGVLWFVYPFVSFLLARPIPHGGAVAKAELTKKQKELLVSHSRDMWGFFRDNVGEHTKNLPPDNLQLSPVEDVAMRTSPTNIGFYLLSVLAARDMGFLDTEELFRRIESTLNTVESLEKWRGNLFNWYDLTDGSVIGDGFVSSVDSGNFVVMLITLAEGLEELASECPKAGLLSKRCRAVAEATELEAFFDGDRMLFSIGYRAKDKKLEQNCYDLLMSEARMTGYYAVAAALVPKDHWQKLGRTLTKSDGYLGMLSWSGTAFEYLLPQLFLPLFNDSFLYESIKFSLMLQQKNTPVWGVSESGYYAFDSSMHYRYKAHGTKGLALRRLQSNENVVSPYSTYLSLCVCGTPAIKNLVNLKKLGMYGKYGLFEALDLSRSELSGGLRVRSYMAHHVGMSIIACANAVKDRVFVRRFMSDNRMGSAAELLQEKVPVNAHLFETEKALFKKQKRSACRNGTENDFGSADRLTLLSGDGPLSAVISREGHVCLRSSRLLLTNTVFDMDDGRYTLGLTFLSGERAYGCAPIFGKGEYHWERDGHSVSHINGSADFSGRVRYSFSSEGNCFLISAQADHRKKYDVVLSFEPVMEQDRDFYSHISFSRLFTESEYDSENNILFFKRRSKKDGKYVFFIGVALEDGKEFLYRTSKNGLAAFSLNRASDASFAETDCVTGACIDPLCVAKASDRVGGQVCFLVSAGKTKKECIAAVRSAKKEQNELFAPKNPAADALLSGIMLGETKKVTPLIPCGIGDLWGMGISGDCPIVVIKLFESRKTQVRELLEGFFALRCAGVMCEMVFLLSGDEKYERPLEKELESLCRETSVWEFVSAKGGIFFLHSESLSDSAKNALFCGASTVLELDGDSFSVAVKKDKNSFEQAVSTPQGAMPLPDVPGGIKTKNGFFDGDSYTVDKSLLPQAPFSYVLTGKRFSSVVTHSGLGYTFFDNARENRLCSFFGDASCLDRGERLLLTSGKTDFDLCACSSRVTFCRGRAEYCGRVGHCDFCVRVTVSEKFPIKLIRVFLSDPTLVCRFVIRPSMGDTVFENKRVQKSNYFANGVSAFLFCDPLSASFPQGVGFCGVWGGSAEAVTCSAEAKGSELLFFLGCCTTVDGAKNVCSRVCKSFFDGEEKNSDSFARSLVPPVFVKTKSATANTLLNSFLPYQIAGCRFLARGSFYQCGGAYGFRDQLQDCLSLVYSHSDWVKTHIFRCCAHQYEEGSVMHWWHTRSIGGSNRGTKTKCSDDLLWLPFSVADYLEKTGDSSVLEKEIPYVTSQPLGAESERYELPTRSRVRESVYRHCIRALAYADRRGEHGLILLGSCDWNDAFSLAGEKGKGESVFSTLLFICACNRFLPVMDRMGDTVSRDHFSKAVAELKENVEKHAFFEDRYARMFCDDGSVFGVESAEECKIDIVCQGMASLAETDKKRAALALSTAYKKLFDPKNRLFCLFSPPFTQGEQRVGYVRGYVSGIRENGGQYTHGALFGVSGMLKLGMTEEALTVLSAIDPIARYLCPETAKKYKTEPYVLTADIYSGQHAGRGGWSWYTGAASWYYRIFFEQVLGLELTEGFSKLDASPLVPYEAKLRFGDWELEVTASESCREPLFDGAPTVLPICLKKGKHTLLLPLKK